MAARYKTRFVLFIISTLTGNYAGYILVTKISHFDGATRISFNNLSLQARNRFTVLPPIFSSLL